MSLSSDAVIGSGTLTIDPINESHFFIILLTAKKYNKCLAVILSLIKFKVPLHSYGFYLLRHGFYLSCDRAHTCQAETIPITLCHPWRIGVLVLTEDLKSRCGVAL